MNIKSLSRDCRRNERLLNLSAAVAGAALTEVPGGSSLMQSFNHHGAAAFANSQDIWDAPAA